MKENSKPERFFSVNEKVLLSDESNLVKKSYWVSWIIGGISLLVMGLMWNSLPKTIPLFYSLPWGELRLANKAWLGMLPSLGLVFSWLNLSLTKTIWQKDKFVREIMAVVSLVETGLLTMVMLGIMSIVI